MTTTRFGTIRASPLSCNNRPFPIRVAITLAIYRSISCSVVTTTRAKMKITLCRKIWSKTLRLTKEIRGWSGSSNSKCRKQS